MKKIKREILNEFGFTLIELLVTMTIMGILTVIGLASFKGTQIKSRDARRKSDLNSISKALNMYFNDNNTFPSGAILSIGGEFKTGSGNNEIIYMKEVPKELTSGIRPYTYIVSTTGKSFKILANLENGEDGSCLKSDSSNVTTLDGYSISTTNKSCIFGVSSSNIGVTTPVASML